MRAQLKLGHLNSLHFAAASRFETRAICPSEARAEAGIDKVRFLRAGFFPGGQACLEA
jgi:hypothetical protein